MIAIFILELRQNGKWACIAMLVIAGMMAGLAFAAVTGGADFAPVLVNGSTNLATAIAFPACGFVLGLLVILPDYSVGRWALLTHRPIGRSRIFLGKLLAAGVLYLMAAGVPLAALVVWAAMPGRVAAPFEWGMVLPRLAHLLVGMMWLSAGMLVAARKARWLGSRLVAAAGAAAVSLLLLSRLFEFVSPTDPFVIPGVAAALLAAAAWAAFSAGGVYEAESWAGRTIETAAVGAGIVVGMFGIGLWLALLLAPYLSQPAQHYSAYEMDNRGEVFRLDRSWTGPVDTMRQTYTDVTGHAPAATDIDSDAVVRAGLPGLNPPARSLFDAGRYVQPIDSQQSWRRQWYFLPRKRTVEEFDTTTRRYAGSLGPGGFVAPGKSPQPFPGPLHAVKLPEPSPSDSVSGILYSAHRVWELDTGDQPGIDLFFDTSDSLHRRLEGTAPDDPILGVAAWVRGGRFPSTPRPLKLIVVCRSSVAIVQEDMPPVRIEAGVPISPTSTLSIAHLDNGGYSLLFQEYRAGWPTRIAGVFIQADRTGRVIARMGLPELSFTPSLEPVSQSVLLAVLLPPGLMLRIALAYYHRDPDAYNWFSLASLVMALLSAVVGRVLMRRYATTAVGKWGWTIACAVLGVAGILLLLCMRTREARNRCPACRRNRLVSRQCCEHCGQPFPPPARTGIEIFESRQAVEAGA